MRLWQFVGMAVLLAGPARAEFNYEPTYGPWETPVTPDGKGFAIMGKMDALGATVLGDGTVDAAKRTAYLLVKTDTVNCQLVTIPLDRGAAPLTVTARLDLPEGIGTPFSMDASDELRIFTIDKIITITRDGDTPTAATVQNISPLSGFKTASYSASTGQLFLLGSVIPCYERTGNTFTLRAVSFATGDDLLGMNDGRYVVRTGGQVNFFRWPMGATIATWLGAASLGEVVPTGANMAIFGSGIAVAGRDSFHIVDPIQLTVTSITTPTDATPKLIPFSEGVATNRLQYFNALANWNEYTIPATNHPATVPGFRAAAAAGTDVLLAPPPVAGKQALYSLTTRPVFDTNYLEGTQLSVPYSGYVVSGVEFKSLKPGVRVKAVLYSRGFNDTSHPFELRAESDPFITGEAGTVQVIPLGTGSSLATQTNLMWSMAIQTDQPGAIGDVPKTDSALVGYRLAIPDGVVPFGYEQSDLLPRSGAPGIRLRAQPAVWANPIQFRTYNAIGTTPITRSPKLGMSISGHFYDIDFSETADFSDAVSLPFNEYGDNYSYTLKSSEEGIHPLWVRMRLGRQDPIIQKYDVLLDSTPPGPTGTPTDQGKWLYPAYMVSAEFAWAPAQDNPGGVGGVTYEYAFTRVPPPGPDGPKPTISGSGTSTTPNASVLVAGTLGHLTFKVRAVDRLGNRGPWSAPTDGIELLPRTAPVLTDVTPNEQFVNQPHASFDYVATADVATRIHMTEDPAFAAPQDESWYGTGRVTFNLPNLQNGRHVVYHRLKNPYGFSAVKETGVFLDTVAPVAEAPVPDTRQAASGLVSLGWRLPEDPQPASGTAFAELRLVRQPSGEPVTTSTLTLASETTVTLAVEAGGTFRAELRATDKAGNAGPWAASAAFDLNTAPHIELLPPDYAILEGQRIRVRARWQIADAEGSPLTVDIYLRRADGGEPLLVATGLAGDLGEYVFDLALPDASAYRVVIQAHDGSGVDSTATSAPLAPFVATVAGWVLE